MSFKVTFPKTSGRSKATKNVNKLNNYKAIRRYIYIYLFLENENENKNENKKCMFM